VSVVAARAEAEPPAGERTLDKVSPQRSGKHPQEKGSPFSTAGRELTDDELNRIVGGL